MKMTWRTNKKRYGLAAISVLSMAPQISLAALGCTGTDCNFKSFVDWVIASLFKPIVPILVSLTVVYFLWGTASYILQADDIKKREEGRQKMFYGIIGLAVMLSFWALARIIRDTLFV